MSTKHIFRGLIAATFVLACFVSSNVEATVIGLADGNSTASIDTGSSSGMNTWTVDGIDQLFQQWFWYRVGASGPESSIDTLSSTILSSTVNSADILFTGSGFKIDVIYNLQGGVAGSGTAGITENITITNTSLTALDFHFFQYSDFDLNATPGADSVKFIGAQIVDQTTASGAVTLSESIVSPAPTHHEASFFAAIRTKLTDGSATTLNDSPGIGISTGVGDVTWAFEWDHTINPGGSLSIVKGKTLQNTVPEPASLAIWGLLAFGMAVGSRFRRRQS